MNYIKSHMFPLICGLVVVLSLGALYWPISTMQAALKTDLENELNLSAKKARDMAKPKVKLYTYGELTGPIVDATVRAKQEEQDWMKGQADEIAKAASQANRHLRVEEKNGRLIPLLGGVPEDHYLPKINKEAGADPFDFKTHYEELLGINPTKVTGWLKTLNAGMPYTQQEAQAEVDTYQAQRAAQAPRDPRTRQLLDPTAGTLSKAEADRYRRSLLVQRAQALRVYANSGVFQRRAWANPGGSTAPSEREIFEAFIDCCIMQNLVGAVAAINKDSASVETSPVKRIGSMVIGAAAAGAAVSASGTGTGGTSVTSAGAGPLFLGQGQGTPKDTGTGAAKSTLDYARSLTGRVGSERYDVTHVRLLVYVDPSYLNEFIKEIYKQNNSYTVLNVRVESADPFSEASEGYLYGKTPVIKADILLEAVFYRFWTVPLMPDVVRNDLGIPATKTGV